MSSLTRRMQRIQRHTTPIYNEEKGGCEKVEQAGRTTGLVHFADNLGKLANPKAKDRLARLAREQKTERNSPFVA